MKYRFTLILPATVEMTEELAEALHAAGCDDGLPGMHCGVPRVDFIREAQSFGAAVRSAIAHVRATGIEVERIEFAPALADQLTAAGA